MPISWPLNQEKATAPKTTAPLPHSMTPPMEVIAPSCNQTNLNHNAPPKHQWPCKPCKRKSRKILPLISLNWYMQHSTTSKPTCKTQWQNGHKEVWYPHHHQIGLLTAITMPAPPQHSCVYLNKSLIFLQWGSWTCINVCFGQFASQTTNGQCPWLTGWQLNQLYPTKLPNHLHKPLPCTTQQSFQKSTQPTLLQWITHNTQPLNPTTTPTTTLHLPITKLCTHRQPPHTIQYPYIKF